MQPLCCTEIFKKIQKQEIGIDYEPAESKMPSSSSKIGGYPDLPTDFEWPYYEGVDYDDVKKNRPLSFLAQINLKDIAEYDNEKVLPNEGMLYFFYELGTMTWGYDPKDKGSAKVFYFDGDLDTLLETEIPSDISKDYIVPEFSISFKNSLSLPAYEEFAEYHVRCDWDSYDEQKVAFGWQEPEDFDMNTKLLGYADIIQASMLEECEYSTNGIYTGDGNVNISKEQEKEYFENSKDWTLLFQMGTISSDDYELMFGDCGNIYFYIKKSDLAEKNFDNIWLILQCS